MAMLLYIIQIAFFGAAGSSFVFAHLKNLRASDLGGQPPAQRWRMFRHPHKRGASETKEQLELRRAAALQTAWGYCFLGGALVTPLVFRWLHIGA